ncbi:MAG TPA: alpha/beta family hydrolase [Acidimicrobiales bacterium]|nr:alpha/beta family hydrolase [Acidimicrobiales bacterium]
MSPDRPSRGLLLAPGASAGPDQPALVAIDRAATAAGVAVQRIGLARGGKPPALIEVVRRAAAGLAEAHGLEPAAVAMGGRSFGGRICSMAAADGVPCLALVLVSYPLHPPGRPDTLRVDHFPALTIPCLFVSGTRDAFATPAELESHTAAIPGPVHRVWIDGADHGLRGRDADVAAAVVDWLISST